jgi:6-phosphogluconolactonase (cycloisomerase 2 family)
MQLAGVRSPLKPSSFVFLLTIIFPLLLVMASCGSGGAPMKAPSILEPAPSPPPPPAAPPNISLSIVSPKAGDMLPSPVYVDAGVTGGAPPISMELLVDGSVTTRSAGNSLKFSVPLKIGQHKLTVRATDAQGSRTEQTFAITVPAPRFAYVGNCSDSTVSVFSIDSETGQLRPRGLSPAYQGPCTSQTVTVPSGEFVYAINGQACGERYGLSAFSADRNTGQLTPVPGSPFIGFDAFLVRTHPNGRFLYVADFCNDEIDAFSIDQETGVPRGVPGAAPFAAHMRPIEIATHPSGKFLYATDEVSGNIFGFKIDLETGELSAMQGFPYSAGERMGVLTYTPDGRFLYAAATSGLFGFEISPDTGELHPLRGSPFRTPAAGAIVASQRFVYSSCVQLAHVDCRHLAVLSIDPQTGALRNQAEHLLQENCTSLTLDPSGKFLFAGQRQEENGSIISDRIVTMGSEIWPSPKESSRCNTCRDGCSSRITGPRFPATVIFRPLEL